MLSTEQQQKAHEAISKAKERETKQRRAMMYRLLAYADLHFDKILLPYKILYDLHKAEHEKTFTEIFPNKYYPQPGISLKLKYGKPDYRGDTSKLPLKPFTYEGKTIEVPDLMADPEYKQQTEEYESKVQAEKMDISQWGYWYSRFLLPYDLESFTDFDFWGDIPKDDEERQLIQTFRNACIEAKKDCQAHPDRYNMKAVEKLTEHREKYDTPYGYI